MTNSCKKALNLATSSPGLSISLKYPIVPLNPQNYKEARIPTKLCLSPFFLKQKTCHWCKEKSLIFKYKRHWREIQLRWRGSVGTSNYLNYVATTLAPSSSTCKENYKKAVLLSPKLNYKLALIGRLAHFFIAP